MLRSIWKKWEFAHMYRWKVSVAKSQNYVCCDLTQVPFLMMWREADIYALFWKPRTICLSSVEPSTTCFCAFPIKEKVSSWLWQSWFNCICWLQSKSEGLRISCLQVFEYFDRQLAFGHTGGASFCCASCRVGADTGKTLGLGGSP